MQILEALKKYFWPIDWLSFRTAILVSVALGLCTAIWFIFKKHIFPFSLNRIRKWSLMVRKWIYPSPVLYPVPIKPFFLEVLDADIFLNREAFLQNFILNLGIHSATLTPIKITGVNVQVTIGSYGFAPFSKSCDFELQFSKSGGVRFEDILPDVLLKRAEQLFNGRDATSCNLEINVKYEDGGVVKNLNAHKETQLVWREINQKPKRKLHERDRIALLMDWIDKEFVKSYALINFSEIDEKLGLNPGDSKMFLRDLATTRFSGYVVEMEGDHLIKFKIAQQRTW